MQGNLYSQLRKIRANEWDSRLADSAAWRFEEARSPKPSALFRLTYRCKITGWEYLGGYIDVDQADLIKFKALSDPREAWIKDATRNILKMIFEFDEVVKKYMKSRQIHHVGAAGGKFTVDQYANPDGLIVKAKPKLTVAETKANERFFDMLKQYQSWKKRAGKR